MHFIAFVHKDEDTSFGISFPDFPGCISAGDTLEEAVKSAQEALAFHVEGMLEDDETIPQSRSLDDIMQDDDLSELREGATFVHIPLITLTGRIKKANITMDAGLLSAIDKVAKERGVTRSGFLADLAKREILHH